jgi:ribosomal protein L37AE/L43A
MNIHQITESYHVIDRRDGERVAGGFGTLEAAEAWIEKTDRRGSGEFEARETVAECEHCSHRDLYQGGTGAWLCGWCGRKQNQPATIARLEART